ncbi:LuxR C-terminal-related transcriptional regulator [Bradyrhizobium sp. OAE829]|uniref:LuxR C-terminal-related transcriptional regulator n=1 Tax=Bradyrhizobium sp. OAE829 TaxID=2663807 RepID=UPI001788EDD8
MGQRNGGSQAALCRDPRFGFPIAPVLHTLFLLTRPPARAAADLTVLTNRQRELVDLALTALPDEAIARQLKISEDTVGNHFLAVYERFGIRKRSQLIALLR